MVVGGVIFLVKIYRKFRVKKNFKNTRYLSISNLYVKWHPIHEPIIESISLKIILTSFPSIFSAKSSNALCTPIPTDLNSTGSFNVNAELTSWP